MEYNFAEIEQKWRNYWIDNKTYKVEVDETKPKFYVLDMFPYPSGAGLHVGHPLGYIASDIYSRYKRLNGFNVLHPMGYDAYGLPAEQYAIQTGQHPAITTENNIKRYREQLDKFGFSYDWSREVRTSDPKYYKWTQWAFVQMFNHWYNKDADKAESIDKLIEKFSQKGNSDINAASSYEDDFDAEDWSGKTEVEQQEILLNYRLAFLAETTVNWCPELGTVLANDEVKEGLSVRGGYAVEQKKMKQWSLRITAYAQRLLEGLDTIEWSDSLKEVQKNWIGRSQGADVLFKMKDNDASFTIFTTRPDTLFGCTFMVLAPESELVDEVVTDEYKEKISEYVEKTKKRSERERIAEVKKVSGQFTGSYAIHPLSKKEIPIYISDYVLAGYGTGAIMAVPAHDSRDYAFAKHFDLPIVEVVSGGDISIEAYEAKDGVIVNSDFINGMMASEAILKITEVLEEMGIGTGKINYRLRDAIFSRQRYWGEPFPVFFKNGMPYAVEEDKLPLLLPEIDKYLPTEDGEPPLARANNWKTDDGYSIELSTMPGFAGSSAYSVRYMDPLCSTSLVSKKANEYWQDVDLYIGGIEHATGHLIYSRFWNKFLYDIGEVCSQEPYKKLVNQGMIQGRSSFVYRVKGENKFISYNQRKDYSTVAINVDVNIVSNDILDVESFRKWRPEFKDAEFILEDGKFICGYGVEKMSKSLYNVVNPDDIIDKYGADTLRMYEMFLGPLELSKPWDTNGIDGVHRFLKKLWKLFYGDNGELKIVDGSPSDPEHKIINKTIKKITSDIEKFSFNTSISAFMICVNELSDLKCNKREIFNKLTVLLSPFAPHISEELWSLLGNKTTVCDAKCPICEEKYLVENTLKYPVSFNGKMRFLADFPADMSKDEVHKQILVDDRSQKWLDGKEPKKVIVVPGKIINIVL